MAYRILEHDTVPDAIQRIAEELVSEVSSEVDDGALSPDRRVHQVRKACKRMRALLRLIRPALKQDVYKRENERFRDLARLAGGARDAKVALDCFDELIGDEPEDLARAAGIRARLADHLSRLGGSSDPSAALEVIRPQLSAAWSALEVWELRGKDFRVIGAGYMRTYERGREAFELATNEPTAENLHEWRKFAKYALYQTQLLRDLWKGPMRERRRAFERLTEDLGAEHDLHVLRGELIELGGGDHLDDILRDLEFERERLRRRYDLLGARLYVESPRAHQRRIRKLWKLWRRPI